jgi:ATP-binding cassette, subfamily C (CFTR/MRP), member 1
METQVLKPNEKICPEADAGIFSRWTYSWLDPLMKLGKSKPLETTDLYVLDENRRARMLGEDLEDAWKQEMLLENPDLFHTLTTRYFWKWFPIGVYRFASDMGTNFSPLLLRYLIEFVQETASPNPPSIGFGLSYAIGLFAVQLYISVVQNHFFHLSLTQALTFRAAFVSAIFRKSTRLSAAARREFNSGKVTNLVSTDVQRIESFTGFGHVIWTAPIQFLIITTLLIINLGPAALAGIGVLIALLPIQRTMMLRLQALRKQVAPVTDSRVKLIQEIISGIRVIKFFTWELPFLKQVEDIREKEVQLVRQRGYTSAMVFAVAFSVPVFSTAVAIIIYGSMNTFDPARVFSSLALFNQLRYPLTFFPMGIVQYVEFKVALNRIQELFLAPDSDDKTEKVESDYAIEINDATFVWQSFDIKTVQKPPTDIKKDLNKVDAADDHLLEMQEQDKPTLTNITLKIPKGKLIAICGTVGSGKSTLLNSLVGETQMTFGTIKISGSLGFAPQQAWIQNATIKDNILFGLPYEQEKYLKVIRSCALEKDLEILPDGDQTEIGERGINLSGIIT